MNIRCLGILAALLIAAPAARALPAPIAALPATVTVPVLAAADVQGPDSGLDRRAIFEILCGGMALPDPALRAHLWRVAGSLAARSWTPPRVTVRIVVSPPAR